MTHRRSCSPSITRGENPQKARGRFCGVVRSATKSRQFSPKGKSGHAQPLPATRLSTFGPGKETYVRNCSGNSARIDVARSTPQMATQPELGLFSERRTGLGAYHLSCAVFVGQDLSRISGPAAGGMTLPLGHECQGSTSASQVPSFGFDTPPGCKPRSSNRSRIQLSATRSFSA